MEHRHVRFFLALADELHFTRAAQRLMVAQPHLSQEIRKLERELGTELFYRTRRQVELTAAGIAFRSKAIEIARAMDEAKQAAQRAARGATGRLVIGFAGSAGYDLLPATIRLFRSKWPDVDLELRQLPTFSQLSELRERRLDVGFLRKSLREEPAIASRLVRREKLIVALPAGHPLTTARALRLVDLAAEPWIVFDRTPIAGLFGDFQAACADAGFEPIIAQEAGEIPTIINLVASGLGCALVPESVTALRRRGVVYRKLRGCKQVSHLVVAWREQAMNTVLRNFLETVKQV